MTSMKLEIRSFPVRTAVTSDRTHYASGRLEIDRRDIDAIVAQFEALAGVDVDVAAPGESTRIINILDTVPAIWKPSDDDLQVFPGFVGPPRTVGRGVTHRLDGLAVMACAEMPAESGGLLIPREAIVDMSGPAAPMTAFSETVNVVLRFDLAPGKSEPEYDAAVRQATLLVAARLAEATKDAEPETVIVQSLDLPEEVVHERSLPRIGYVHQIHAQGNNANTFVYGRSFYDNLPTLIHPNELTDGAVVSGNYAYGAFKTSTYLHAQLPVVRELLAGHGRDHIMLPVIISRGHNYSIDEKVRSAQYAAQLARLLAADGVVVTWEGGGNSIVDAMQTVKALEQAGIKTTTISYEMSGTDDSGVRLLDSVPEADAVISAGSTEQPVSLPAVRRVLGGTHLRLSRELGGERLAADEARTLELLHQMYGAANQVGFGTLTCKPF